MKGKNFRQTQIKETSGISDEIIRTSCFMCGHEQCGVLVHIKRGKVVKIEGDPEDPITQGVTCAKPHAAKQLLYHTDRLKYPLKREGERGEGKWRRISWNEALDTIANKLVEIRDKNGPEAVVFCHGHVRDWSGLFMFIRFVNAFGSPNLIGPAHMCLLPRGTGAGFTFGAWGLGALEYPDYANTNCILVWGTNPASTFPIRMKEIIDAKVRGATCIVIDPRYTETAAKADLWLRVRPGTDAALALAMLNVIIEKELYDKAFVNKWTLGFDKLAERVKDYPPKKVSGITWVPEDQIIEAAIMYATNKPACITWGNGIDQNINPVQTARAICALAAVVGNIDIPGGNILVQAMQLSALAPSSRELILANALRPELQEKRLGLKEYPLHCNNIFYRSNAHAPTTFKAMLTDKPYPIKAMYVQAANPVQTQPNSTEVIKALKKLEFLVVADLFMTATAELADIVLPAACWLEKNDLAIYPFRPNIIRARQKVAEIPECWPDAKIIIELAKRIEDVKTYFPWSNEEEFLDYLLKPLGITFEELKKKVWFEIPIEFRKYEREGFRTPSRKIELYSTGLKELGYDPLPLYIEPPESGISTPELAKEYPLILTSRKDALWFHTEYRNLPWLREIIHEPEIEINPKTAESLGIKEGDMVIVESLRGRAKVKAKMNEGLHPKVVVMPVGWSREANFNLLTDNGVCSRDVGSNPLRGFLCKIRKPDLR